MRKARSRLRREGKDDDCNCIVASLPLDVWRFLLVSRLEPTVWRTLRVHENGGTPNYPGTRRSDFEERRVTFYDVRNRCSHQEHLVMLNASIESAMLDKCSDAPLWATMKIDSETAEWISANSRVADVRA